jgi:hypothetical protein
MFELVDVLGSSAVHHEPDSVMQRLHGQAQGLAQFQCPSTRTVGFVGDSGAGKTSTDYEWVTDINSAHPREKQSAQFSPGLS